MSDIGECPCCGRQRIPLMLYTTAQLAEACGVSPKTVGQWEKEKRIRAVKGGKTNKRWCPKTTLGMLCKFEGIHVKEYIHPVIDLLNHLIINQPSSHDRV